MQFELLDMPIAGYFRLSTKEQATEETLASHAFAIRSAAEEVNRVLAAAGKARRELPPEMLFHEIRSGRNNRRPVFRHILDLIKTQQICCLITRLDRLTRDAWMNAEIARLMEDSPVLLWDILKSRFIDFGNPEDWAEFHISGVNNAKESRSTSKRIRLRNDFNRSQGKAHAGKMPFGFKRSQLGKYEVIPEKAAAVRRIAEIFCDTRSPLDTVRIANEEFGECFSSYQGLVRWLNNEALRGHTPHLRKRDKRSLPNSAQHTIYNTHEPPLDRQTIARIDRILAENKRIRGRSKAGKIYPIAGLLRCAHCGSDVHLTSISGSAYAYCSAYRKGIRGTICGDEFHSPNKKRHGVGMRSEEIEAATIAALCSRAAVLANHEIREIAREIEKPQRTKEELEAELEIAKLESMAADMPHLAEHFRAAIAQLKLKLVPPKTEEANLEEQRQWLIKIGGEKEYWEMMKLVDRKEFFQQFIKAIVIDRHTRAIEVQLWV